MDTKQYLGQIKRYDALINNGIAEVARYRQIAMNITTVIANDKVKSTPDPDRLGKTVAKIIDLENELDILVDKYIDARNVIVGQLEQLEDTKFYSILFKFYVENKELQDIADEMDYSYGRIRNLHGMALEAFRSKFGTKYCKK